MALDGAFLRHLKTEINNSLLGSRIDKIYQPGRDEIVLLMRGGNCSGRRLLLSAKANSPRISFITNQIENPATPPMLCMLLRKKLTGARFSDCSQPGLERALRLDFDSYNELGDEVKLSFIIEIMGKYSNIILLDQNDIIIDSIHRVDASMSGVRLVLPGVKYQLPPSQDKLDLTCNDIDKIIENIYALSCRLDKAILNTVIGISPIVSRELAEEVLQNNINPSHELSQIQKNRLRSRLEALKETIIGTSGKPVLVSDLQNKPVDFSFIDVNQYGSGAKKTNFDSFSQLLEAFYDKKDSTDRIHAKALDLLKVLSNCSDRISRRIGAQTAELEQTADRDTLKIYGDLLSTYMYMITPGSLFADVVNYYSPEGETVRIPLDPLLSPSRNVQKYYSRYRKAQTAEKVLTEQIEKGKEELEYIDSVFDALSRVKTESELAEIRQELVLTGYIHSINQNKKQPAALPPISFTSDEGFEILVGRNNRQNDRLTMKTAKNYDLWFHARNIPGAHVVIITNGKTPGQSTVEYAASLAARHSKAG
ncbi:MAG: NFACT family protein, partial [Clostridia bacterium]|nr:NFACT family protein [Clostridia bacterium]